MNRLRKTRRLTVALACAALSVMAVSAIAIADQLFADGDGLAPVSGDNNMAFGSVSCDADASKNSLLAIFRQGGGAQVFKNGATVTLAIQSITGPNASAVTASFPSGNTISMPSNWESASVGTQSSAVTSNVKIHPTSSGAGSATINYVATGVDASSTSNNTLTRSDSMEISWTAGSCTPPDTTAPSSSASAKNADATTYPFGDWTNQNVTVTLNGQDNVGLKEIRYTTDGTDPSASVGTVYNSPFTISAEGTTTVKFVAIDTSNNVETPVNSRAIKIDKTAPVISLRPAGDSCSLPGLSGWCRGEQFAGFRATEATSGLANGQTSPYDFTESTTTNGGAVMIPSGTLDDNAGNTSNSVDAGPYKIDSVAPSVSVTGVANGASYTLGSVPTAGCKTTDTGGSGVLDEATVGVSGGTANGVGTFTATCSNGKDVAGNPQGPASVSYKVVYGGVSGILQPINPDNSSLFSRGRAVPVKFQLAGDPPAFVTSGWTLKRIAVNCATLGDVGTIPESVESVTPSTVFRYDSEGDQYIYNADFRDKAAGTCWRVQVTLDDGTVMTSAIFKLQK